MQIIEDTTRLVNGRYEVGMLWRKDERWFPNNLVMARQRLQSLRRRLMKSGNEEMAIKDREVMDSYISSGFSRKWSEKELAKESSTHWYLHEEDQDSLRFLWRTNAYEDPPDVYVIQVHIFVAVSFPCVANSTLRRVADDNADDFSPSVIAAIKGNFSVDDALPSENDEQPAIHLARDMVDILA